MATRLTLDIAAPLGVEGAEAVVVFREHLCRYHVANCYVGSAGLIHTGGTGLIYGRKDYQPTLDDGIRLLNMIEEVFPATWVNGPYPFLPDGFLRLLTTTHVFSAMKKHTHVHPSAEKRALQIRLRKIAGQVAAIERMIDDDRDCPDVLTQVVPVRKALKSFAEVIIHQHRKECIELAGDQQKNQRMLRELIMVLERYID